MRPSTKGPSPGPSQGELNLYVLTGVYADAYAAIVQPEKVFKVTRYFLKEWAPLLGPAGFWLIVALRQRCYWNNRQNWCIVGEKTLAAESGVSDRTLRRIKDEVEDRPEDTLFSWFFRVKHRRRWSDEARHTVRAADRYDVLLDDPLTPGDQAGLTRLLREAMLRGGDPLESVMAELKRLSDTTDGTLPGILAEAAAGAEKLSPSALTVLDVVKSLQVWPKERGRQAELGHLCSEVQNAIVRPDHAVINTQYFRLKWLSELGPALGLLVLVLRSRCYYNKEAGELRDECQAHWSELAAAIGRGRRTLLDVRKANEKQFQAFVKILDDAVGRSKARFKVQMRDPLLPVDAVQFDALVRGDVASVDPETGQIAMSFLGLGQAHHGASPGDLEKRGILTVREALKCILSGTGRWEVLSGSEIKKWEVLSGSENRKWEVLSGSEARKREVLSGSETEVGSFVLEVGSFVRTIKALKAPSSRKALLKKKNVGFTVPKSVTTAEAMIQAFSSSLVPVLLDDFGITGTARQKILAGKPDFRDVAGWMLYAVTRRGLDEDRLEGYVVKRLLHESEPAPEDFRLLADLLPAGWTMFWRADKYASAYLDTIPNEYQDLFQVWQRHFGGFFPDGPFGGDAVEAGEVWEQVLAALGDQAPDGTQSCEVFAADRSCRFVIEAADTEAAAWLEANEELVERALVEQGVYHGVEVVWPQEEEAGAGERLAAPMEAPACGEPLGGVYPEQGRGTQDRPRRTTENARFWQAALSELQLQMTKATFDTWVRSTRLVSCQDGTFIISAQDEFTRDWLENRLRTTVERTLVGIVGKPVEVKFVVT